MGTWDTGSFDNDDAMDWVYELEEADDLSILTDSFETVLEQRDDSPDETDCTFAICAAEVVAGLMGNPANDLPAEVMDWIDDQPPPPESLRKMARSSLKVILRDSGLKELWEETDIYPEWVESIRDLLARLQEA